METITVINAEGTVAATATASGVRPLAWDLTIHCVVSITPYSVHVTDCPFIGRCFTSTRFYGYGGTTEVINELRRMVSEATSELANERITP